MSEVFWEPQANTYVTWIFARDAIVHICWQRQKIYGITFISLYFPIFCLHDPYWQQIIIFIVKDAMVIDN